MAMPHDCRSISTDGDSPMRKLLMIVAALTAAAGASPLAAQDKWPSRPIKLIVPFAAGGNTDAVARIAANHMQNALGVSVIIENRGGAGGIVGTDTAAKSAPDGYTFCVCSVGAVSVAPFAQKVSYDPAKDLAPVSIISTIVQAVVVKKSLPVNSMAELVAYAKANPGKLNYGSSGAGGLTHYAVELFEARTGTHMVHVPFRGGAPATAALVAGEIDLSFANMTDAMPQIEAGTVRGLAVTSKERSPYFPNIPSIHETVVPGFMVETWNGIIAPPKTPEPIIAKLSEALIKMADDPDFKEAMRKAGGGAVKSTPAEFRAQIEQEMAQWKPLVAEILEKEKKKEAKN
jgi:tripartite-type tricarboxylate transporter receptor subunit TctC